MKFIWVVLFSFMLSDTAYAISPMSINVIKEAQQYGKIHMHNKFDDFLRPWVSYEEKAERLNEKVEQAWLYTPFLLIATDAREKSLKGEKPELVDSERILNGYAGTLSFSVVLYGSEPQFGRKAKVILKQGKKHIEAYEVAIPRKAEKTTGYSDKSAYRLQCYFYFWDKKVVQDKPLTLSIVTGDKKEHHFYFATANIK